jgi:hypothetical protein
MATIWSAGLGGECINRVAFQLLFPNKSLDILNQDDDIPELD